MRGSGGFRTILQNASALEKRGHKSDLFIYPTCPFDLQQITHDIQRSFGYEFSNIKPVSEISNDYDVVFATFWPTAYMAKALDIKTKLYLCQDFEPWFYPMGDSFIDAENTYKLGLQHVCLGKWLSQKIDSKSKTNSVHYEFGVDLNVYHPIKDSKKEHAICAIFQPEKPRRLTDLLLDTVRLLNGLDPTLKIYLYGSTGNEEKLSDLNVEYLGILTTDQCNQLYNKCKVGISLSCTNPSRIPFEMMASGLPVVELDRENNRMDLPENAVHFSECDPQNMAENIIGLLASNSALDSLSSHGITYMQQHGLEEEESGFISCFETACAQAGGHNESDAQNAMVIDEPFNHGTFERTKQLCQEFASIHAKRLRISIGGIPKEANILKVFIWSKPNQEDMIYREIKASWRRDFSEMFDLPLVDTPTLFHIHFYEVINETDVFIGGIQQTFLSSNIDEGIFRRGEFNNRHWQIEAF